MLRLHTLFCAFVLSACSATGPNQGHFASLEQVMATALKSDDPAGYPAEILPALNGCAAKSMVDGVPVSDQQTMLAAINSRQLTPAADELFIKWFGRSMTHGAILKVDPYDSSTFSGGKLHYQDGTAVEAPPANVKARINSNIEHNCPELLKQYPRFFRM